MSKLGIALYGENGHQIFSQLQQNPDCTLIAAAKLSEASIEILRQRYPDLTVYQTLEQLLADARIDLVSVCSPIRASQADDCIAILQSGKHVYAEKPAALDEQSLERILEASGQSGKEFHEMATTAFEPPFYRLYAFMKNKPLGEVVQVYVQKSYKGLIGRPQQDETDGGLTRWVGIHAFRFVEHIVGARIADVQTFETHLGNPVEDGGLHTASSCIMRLENGGVASACINYLNPRCFPTHGNETIRIFGTKGMAEVIDGGASATVYPTDGEAYELPMIEPPEFFDLYVNHLLYGSEMPFEIETELHPLRVAIRAKQNADKCR